AHSRHQHHHCYVSQAHDVDFVLTYSDSFNKHHVFTAGIEHSGNVIGRASKTPKKPARSHAANVDSRICVMRLHAYAITQDCAARVRARRVHGNNSNRVLLLAILPGQVVNQCAFSRAWGSGNSDYACVAAEWKE